MIVITKKEAKKKMIESLFTSGGTLTNTSLFCTGKYKKSIIGHEVVDLPSVAYVYAEKRGDHYKLYSVRKGE